MADFILQEETFYHGTLANFERFRPLSHFGSLTAANYILDTSPTVKYEKLDGLSEISNKSVSAVAVSGSKKIIPVRLNLTNTYEVQDFASCHDLKSYQGFILHHISCDLKMNEIPRFYDYIFKDPFSIAYDEVVREIQKETLYVPEFEQLDRYHLSFQRIIQYFESLGYDGFHYVNQYEDAGHISYIVFRPENIIRQDKIYNGVHAVKRAHTVNPIFPMRGLTHAESVSLHCECMYHDDLFEQKVCRTLSHKNHDHAEKLKAHYAKIFYYDILPKIRKISKQPEFGYHGLSHTEQTVLFGLDIAITCAYDPLPVMLACALHDIRRTNNEVCKLHGARAVPFVRKFLYEYFPRMHRSTVDEIVSAIKYHTNGCMARRDMTAACMWDADRIRLSWDEEYRPEYLSTAIGRKLASLGTKDRNKYIQSQEQFLIRHNLKTAEQIKSERDMNKIAIQRELERFNQRY